MKKCYKCKEEKLISEFHKNKNKADGLQNYCKACAKVRNANYYRTTPERNKQRQASNVRARQKAKTYVIKYLRENPCVDCGESDIVVLEFDHVRGIKIRSISQMISIGWGTDRIQEEIDKCEVRCANCHRRVTAQRGGWYRTLD